MATKDFKIRHSLTVSENATIEGNLTLGGKTVSRLIDSDEVTTIINSSSSGFDSDQVVAIINENVSPAASDSEGIIGVFQDPENGLPSIYATLVGPVQFRAKNDSGSTLFPGTAVYIKGISGEVPTVDKANASSGSAMPAFGLVSAVSNSNADCFVTTFGDLKNINTSAFNVGQTVYISADSDGALTQTKPSGATDLIQNIGLITRVHASAGSIRVGGSGRTNDIDNTTRARLDSDSLAIQGLSTRINSVKDDIDSETARIQLLLLSTDSDALSLAELRQSADSDAAAIVVLKQNAESDSIAIQALSSTLAPRLDSDELAIQATRTEMDVSFNIVNNGTSAYTFTGDGFPSGVDNPTLYLNRGHTYNFRVNASGHPFEIRLSSGGSAYSSGVTNNASQIGEVKFVVPMDAPETLVYQCTAHSGMVGIIKIGKQGFDSDQIASMVLENSSGSGMTDSDLSVVAKLRADLDSDSLKLQALQETVDSLSVGSGFDSDQVVTIINENTGANQTLTITRFDYTATQGQTVFSGSDNNGNSLSYVSAKIQVYLNGILLIDTNDYTATNGTSLTLTVAADSDDTLSIIKYLGADAQASDNLTVTRFTYKYGEDGNSVVGDSEITGGDENGNTLSYIAGKIQVYSNGILLEDSDDYVATDGSTITLRAAPDSDDVVSIFKYLGSEALGFDSEQVVSILNENKIIDYKTYSYDGTLSLYTGTKRLYISIACTLSTVDAYLATASVGADVILNIKKNGSSLNTLTITDGNSISENNSFNVSFVKGDYITVDITQIGSSTAGEDLYANFNFV